MIVLSSPAAAALSLSLVLFPLPSLSVSVCLAHCIIILSLSKMPHEGTGAVEYPDLFPGHMHSVHFSLFIC